MARANIYIHKDNEQWWSDLPDKSRYVNEKIDEDRGKQKPADPYADELAEALKKQI